MYNILIKQSRFPNWYQDFFYLVLPYKVLISIKFIEHVVIYLSGKFIQILIINY